MAATKPTCKCESNWIEQADNGSWRLFIEGNYMGAFEKELAEEMLAIAEDQLGLGYY